MKKPTILLMILLATQLSAQTVLTNKGAYISVVGSPAQTEPSLFVNGKILVETNGEFLQEGRTSLTGDFVNNVTSGNVFSEASTGLVEFKNIYETRQNITGVANKGKNYINFPDVSVNNSGAVSLDATMGMSVENLKLTKGRLILDSKVKDARLVNHAHLLVKNNIAYDRTPDKEKDRGLVQVNFALGDNHLSGKMVGFTPPFKKIYSDYFFYNELSRPTAAGLTGANKQLITSPQYALEGGKGYLLGQGIVDNSDYWEQNWDSLWAGADYTKRATEKFSFLRDFAEPSFTQYATATDRFTGEELNYEDVSVTLEKGWNYVGNPFTTPLDLSTLVDEVAVADEWGVTRALTNVGEVNAKFYVLSGGQGTYNPDATYEPFKFSVSYLLGQKVGSTLELDNNALDKLVIAPMQMFAIGVYDRGVGKKLKLPASKRTHSDVLFYKARNSMAETPIDEILIEVKDQTTQGFDRLTVVFRDNATLASNDKYDTSKIFNYSKGVSQIYTPSSDGKLLTANVISPTTKSLEMALIPTTETQEVSLGAYRLSGLESVSEVVLEDKVAKRTVDLMRTPEYTFTSSPTDRVDRFTLHFAAKGTTGIDVDNMGNSDIYTSYISGNLRLNGLQETDKGSTVIVSDIQGRLLHKSTIQETPQTDIPVTLSQGAYIIKLTGKRTYTAKFLAK